MKNKNNEITKHKDNAMHKTLTLTANPHEWSYAPAKNYQFRNFRCCLDWIALVLPIAFFFNAQCAAKRMTFCLGFLFFFFVSSRIQLRKWSVLIFNIHVPCFQPKSSYYFVFVFVMAAQCLCSHTISGQCTAVLLLSTLIPIANDGCFVRFNVCVFFLVFVSSPCFCSLLWLCFYSICSFNFFTRFTFVVNNHLGRITLFTWYLLFQWTCAFFSGRFYADRSCLCRVWWTTIFLFFSVFPFPFV